MPWEERERQRERRGRDDRDEAHDVLGDEEVGHALDVVDDPPALREHRWQVRELAVEQDQLRHRLGGLRTVVHRDADVGVLDGQRVVDSVAGHRDDMAVGLQRVDEGPLLLRADPAEDRRLSDGRPQVLDVGTEGPGVAQSAVGDVEADPARDRGDGLRVVAGDDLDVHALRREEVHVSLASGRTCSLNDTRASEHIPTGRTCPSSAASLCPSSTTRRPVLAFSRTCSRSGSSTASSTSGAPRT